MRTTLLAATAALAFVSAANADLVLTGLIDGPRAGGTPKGYEFFATTDIADLSVYDVQNYNNGSSTAGTTFVLSGSILAGDYLYVASESVEFTNYFGFAPDFTSGVANINGDDAVALRLNGTIVDVYGEIGVDGTGQPWEHLDSYAYRLDDTGPGATFDASEWIIPGADFLDSQTASGVNGSDGKAVPFGTYTADVVPEPTSLALLGVAGLGLLRRRG